MFNFTQKMLAHQFHLTSKDVNYLTKKRQYFSKGNFSFFYILQYSNRPFNQLSFHVTIKVSKCAVWRNFIRRVIMKYLQESHFTETKIHHTYYKLFLNLNKNMLTELQHFIQQKDKTKIKEYLIKNFQTSFTSFQQFLWKK